MKANGFHWSDHSLRRARTARADPADIVVECGFKLSDMLVRGAPSPGRHSPREGGVPKYIYEMCTVPTALIDLVRETMNNYRSLLGRPTSAAGIKMAVGSLIEGGFLRKMNGLHAASNGAKIPAIWNETVIIAIRPGPYHDTAALLQLLEGDGFRAYVASRPMTPGLMANHDEIPQVAAPRAPAKPTSPRRMDALRQLKEQQANGSS